MRKLTAAGEIDIDAAASPSLPARAGMRLAQVAGAWVPAA
jgi:hypothetical protein